MDARAGGGDFVHSLEPVCASSQVCVAGVALRVSFSVHIVAFGGLSTCETGYDTVCVLELCVSLGGGHGCGGVWACFSAVLPAFSVCAWMDLSILGRTQVRDCGSVCVQPAMCVHV